jgi:uncharacterized protein (UPF0261 family)
MAKCIVDMGLSAVNVSGTHRASRVIAQGMVEQNMDPLRAPRASARQRPLVGNTAYGKHRLCHHALQSARGLDGSFADHGLGYPLPVLP